MHRRHENHRLHPGDPRDEFGIVLVIANEWRGTLRIKPTIPTF